jgi:ATP/maltotriose-dependent transcriptional regulator MalT
MVGGTETVAAASPLLETKLYVPRRRGAVVQRPRLGERLSRASQSKLTLVSAPAGFGKDDAADPVVGSSSDE